MLQKETSSLILLAAYMFFSHLSLHHFGWVSCEGKVPLHWCVVVPEVNCTANSNQCWIVKS